MSISATTYYFASKQDMIRSAFRSLSEKSIAAATKMIERFGGAVPGTALPADEVEGTARYLRGRLRADPVENLTQIELMLMLARDPESRRLFAKDREAVRNFVVSLMERSHSTRPDEDADLILALERGLILESLARGRPADFEDRAVRLIERVMTWLVVHPGTDREPGQAAARR